MDSSSNSNNPTSQNAVQTPPQPVVNKPVPPWISSPAQAQTQIVHNKPADSSKPVIEKDSPPIAIKKSIFSKLIPFFILLILGIGLFFLITKFVLPLAKKTKDQKLNGLGSDDKINLVYWGLWESDEIINPIISEYQDAHPNITVDYSRQSYKDYRERLQSALARNEGPDIFRFHNTWLAMLKKELAPAPSEIAQNINFEENYYPVISQDLKINSQIFGVPLGFDVLALFYNEKILKEAGKTVPSVWDELRRTALDLCVSDAKNKNCGPGAKITTAGVALGTANNVDNFSDILGLMMLQNGVDLTKPSGPLLEDALKFYTLFTITDYVWNETLPSSTYAFATEKVAMILAPSWRAHEIAQINPELEFKTAPVPQLPGSQVSWATYWTEGVSSESQNVQAAWEFLDYLSSKETLIKLYSQASQIRNFGEPYPRKDLASLVEADPIVGSFVKQGEYAKSWYLCSATHDNGINDKMIKYFEDAVNTVLKGEDTASALVPAVQGINQVLNQYGVK